MRRPLLLALSTLGLSGCLHLAPPPGDFAPIWPQHTTVQGSLGITDLSQDPLAAVTAVGGDETVGSTTLPVIMVAVQRPLSGDHLQPGIEWGGSLGWEGGRRYVDGDWRFDEELIVGDLFVGACFVGWLQGGGRLYAGAGPLLHGGWVEYEAEDSFGELVREDESGYGAGTYVRAGIELPVWDNAWFGVQVRWVEAELDFGGAVGEVDVDSVQFLLSATQGW